MANDNNNWYDNPSMPKIIRRKMKLVSDLLKKNDVVGLRKLRDSWTNVKIGIFHNALKSDKYYNDIDGKCYSMEVIKKDTEGIKADGAYPVNAIIHYPEGTVLTPTQLIN